MQSKALASTIINIVMLCVVYAVVGRFALMLAIPPGYATAIFPSSGIAVAALLIWGYRLWPGIFIGSLLLNIGVSIELSPLTAAEFQIALAVATGATLQALAGAWFVQRVIGFPTSLSKEKDIILFMLMAGPVACVISASLGVTSLFLSGVIPASSYVYSWFTWWVGDTTGVLVVTPLMFIAFAQPRQIWRSRRYAVAMPLLLMLVVVIVAFIWVSKWEHERRLFEFKQITTDTTDKLRSSFTSYVDAVTSIERFFVSSSNVKREDFHLFVENMIKQKPGINGLSWNPLVFSAERDDFERSIRAEGFADFTITQRGDNGQLMKADKRDQYTVVKYIEPMPGNEQALGFDVASNADRRVALSQARDSGNAVATSPVTLVQENARQAGFLLFHPVYSGSTVSLEDRRRNLVGYAVGVFRVNDIVDSVLSGVHREKVTVGIYDESALKTKHLYGPEDRGQYRDAVIEILSTHEIAGRHWSMYFWPSADYLEENRAWKAWSALAVGLMFTSLLGAFLLSMTGRSYEIKKLVARRTAELSGVLNNAIDTIITTNEIGLIESCNPAGEALFGYTADELSGQAVNLIIPEFFEQADAAAEPAMSNSSAGRRRDTYGVRKDGDKIPIELAISSLELADKTLHTAIVHDLTERTKVNRMKDEFISVVSHELRTPLTSIKGSLGVVVGGKAGELPKKVVSLLTIAYQNSERLELLINDLLDINKLKSAENSLHIEALCVQELIQKAVAANLGYAHQYGVILVDESAEIETHYVNGDEKRLLQVLSNFISNAVKYSPEGLPVMVSSSKINTDIRVTVKDSGQGIPVEFQDRIFDKFTQADSSDTRRVGGTGLGMAITKSIVEEHGGHVGFDSEQGKGSTFYFELPELKR